MNGIPSQKLSEQHMSLKAEISFDLCLTQSKIISYFPKPLHPPDITVKLWQEVGKCTLPVTKTMVQNTMHAVRY